jgi:hypothetical protein
MRTHVRGHAVLFAGGVYRYSDTGQLAEGWGGEPRACAFCGDEPRPCEEGCGYVRDNSNPTIWFHDPCLGHLWGVRSACCGHGVEPGYVTRASGQTETLTRKER